MRKKIVRFTGENMRKASEIVLGGGTIVYPTDTVYGLGCNPFDEEAVKRVFEVKGRGDKPLPILTSSKERLGEICMLGDKGSRLADKFWPGKLTIVLPTKLKIPCALGGGSVAVRVPGREDTLELIEACGGFLVGTSANLSGGSHPKVVLDAYSQLGESIDLYLDGGATLGTPSTVIDLTKEKPVVLREGALRAGEVLSTLD